MIRSCSQVVALLLLGAVILTGCDLLQPQLSVERAVARLVPNDPPTVLDPDTLIGDGEILRAIEFWVKGIAVPKTGGARIDDPTIQRLVALWAKREQV